MKRNDRCAGRGGGGSHGRRRAFGLGADNWHFHAQADIFIAALLLALRKGCSPLMAAAAAAAAAAHAGLQRLEGIRRREFEGKDFARLAL